MTITSVKGLVGLVTGAASGLGKATVQRMINQGAKGMVGIDLQSFPEEMKNENSLLCDATDVRKEEDVSRALKECKEKFGKLDFVVNCAGVGVAFRTYNFKKNTPHLLSSFQEVMDINVIGTFNVVRLACELLGANAPDVNTLRGTVINTASISAFDGQSGQVAYAASNGAITAMTLPLARDLSLHGIRAVTIAPGLIHTPLLGSLPDNIKEYLTTLVPAPQRLGEPEEYANLVECILCNPYINGEVIRLDGCLRMPP